MDQGGRIIADSSWGERFAMLMVPCGSLRVFWGCGSGDLDQTSETGD